MKRGKRQTSYVPAVLIVIVVVVAAYLLYGDAASVGSAIQTATVFSCAPTGNSDIFTPNVVTVKESSNSLPTSKADECITRPGGRTKYTEYICRGAQRLVTETGECPAGCASNTACNRPPSCSDNIQNQGEAGVDCGGPCTKGNKGACPSCIDGKKNQGEMGVDCGGPCAACLPTRRCTDTDNDGPFAGTSFNNDVFRSDLFHKGTATSVWTYPDGTSACTLDTHGLPNFPYPCFNVTDRCVGASEPNGIYEADCDSATGTAAPMRRTCPTGSACKEGACLRPAASCVTTQRASGIAGKTTSKDASGAIVDEQLDTCASGVSVRETYCMPDNTINTKTRQCASIQYCSNGACAQN